MKPRRERTFLLDTTSRKALELTHRPTRLIPDDSSPEVKCRSLMLTIDLYPMSKLRMSSRFISSRLTRLRGLASQTNFLYYLRPVLENWQNVQGLYFSHQDKTHGLRRKLEWSELFWLQYGRMATPLKNHQVSIGPWPVRKKFSQPMSGWPRYQWPVALLGFRPLGRRTTYEPAKIRHNWLNFLLQGSII